MTRDDFFIGWADETPKADRRFFVQSGAALMLGAAGVAGTAAAFQNAPGAGQWDAALERDWVGLLIAAPYPMLLTKDIDGTQKTALISCLGKCGVRGRFEEMAGRYVAITGSVIQRGQHVMISVVDGPNWLRPVDPVPVVAPERVFVTSLALRGEVLDSKCWFGAMRPSHGKGHKACASLCIRGGIPPAFFASDGKAKGALLILTDRRQQWDDRLLPFVADPVEVRGDVYRRGDQLLFETDLAGITRL